MTLQDIALRWLQAHTYDGLYVRLSDGRHTTECQCELTTLMGCKSANPSCKPGRAINGMIRPDAFDTSNMPGKD